MTTADRRVSELIRNQASWTPHRIAIEDAATGTALTYDALWRRADSGAAALADRGLEPGDRVLLPLRPGPSWMAAFLAIAHADLVAVPVPADAPPALMGLAAAFTGASAWIADETTDEFDRSLAAVPKIRADDLWAANSRAFEPRLERPDATAVYVFTSGATARPRAVALSHRALRANLRALIDVRGALPNEALLSLLPPAHAYELVAGHLAPLSVGARLVCGTPPLPNRVLQAIREHEITRAVVVPALLSAVVRELLQDLAAAGEVPAEWPSLAVGPLAHDARRLGPDARHRVYASAREHIGSAFQAFVVGGAAIDHAWAPVLSVMGIDLDVGYGLTEAGPVVSLGRAGQCPTGSVGEPLPGISVRMGAGGEVLVRTDAVMLGYVNDPAATAAAFDGAWLRTGDCGRIDDAGHLFVTGRLKEAMVTASGETIYPDEIEAWYASSSFAEVAVVPGRGDDGNDRPVLVAVPADPEAPEAEVKRIAVGLRAAAPARLRVAEIVCRRAPLPRTAIGKVRRAALATESRQPQEVS